MAAWLVTGYELVPGVIAHDMGPCSLDWYGEGLALVLACPGRDMIKVWSLPAGWPWLEDAGDQTGQTEWSLAQLRLAK